MVDAGPWTEDRYRDLTDTLRSLAEEPYRAFHQRLVPEVNNLLGVRLPLLQAISREIAKGDWASYLQAARTDTYEETMLQGLVIGRIRADLDTVWPLVEEFVPKVDNWGVCDSFCAGLKIVGSHRAEVWPRLLPYLRSEQEFACRFGVVVLLDFFVVDDYIDRVLEELLRIRSEAYYIQMGVAWALSLCFVRYPQRTESALRQSPPPAAIYQKALQKIVESRRISAEERERVRVWKREVAQG